MNKPEPAKCPHCGETLTQGDQLRIVGALLRDPGVRKRMASAMLTSLDMDALGAELEAWRPWESAER